ncbi:MAG: SDR family oxidoreductase [Chlorobi bacterium]|nr:SDR family oxidoreductase [Chlorobiota bacterium]
MNFELKDKVVLITASSKGIGKAAAELFLVEGSKVVISSSNSDNLKSAAEELKSITGSEPLTGVCDLNDLEDLKNIVKLTKEKFGKIDILVNNCGGPVPGMFDDLDDNKWQHAVEQVLMSVVRLTRGVLPYMKENNWGRIINITSLSVKQPVDNLMLSNSLRSAVTAFAKTLSNEIGKNNITVNNVAPGYTLTSRLHELAELRAKNRGITKEEIFKEMASVVPMKRLADPHEVGAMIVYLASEQAGYITGQTIAVDGGVIKSTY